MAACHSCDMPPRILYGAAACVRATTTTTAGFSHSSLGSEVFANRSTDVTAGTSSFCSHGLIIRPERPAAGRNAHSLYMMKWHKTKRLLIHHFISIVHSSSILLLR